MTNTQIFAGMFFEGGFGTFFDIFLVVADHRSGPSYSVLSRTTSSALRKVPQGTALIKTGQGGTEVSFDKMMVVPVLHIVEMMDISVKRIEIDRSGVDGLICKDNIRADIKVAFFCSR